MLLHVAAVKFPQCSGPAWDPQNPKVSIHLVIQMIQKSLADSDKKHYVRVKHVMVTSFTFEL